MDTIITSSANKKIKEYAQLKKASRRRKEGLFIVDGAREMLAALTAGWEAFEIFHCSVLDGGGMSATLMANKQKTELSRPVFEKLCYKEKPDGWLGVFKSRSNTLASLNNLNRSIIVVLESVEKPGNLGAIIRTAYAAGVAGIIINDAQTDIYNPNVIRASEGLFFSLPVVQASATETRTWLKENKVLSVAALTSAKQDCYQQDLSGPIAIILGTEADGLSQDWIQNSDTSVRIPMRDDVDSLNVSVSAAILIYESLRQHSLKNGNKADI